MFYCFLKSSAESEISHAVDKCGKKEHLEFGNDMYLPHKNYQRKINYIYLVQKRRSCTLGDSLRGGVL